MRPFYAESAREMIERGDWLTPYYNGEPRFDKPVLYYWLVAASYVAAGPSPGAARAPAALAGVGLVLVTFFCARRWYDGPTALLAGLIGATSAGIVATGPTGAPGSAPRISRDALHSWAALVALLDDPRRQLDPRQRRAWLLLAGLAAAGAFLVKGPVGPALVVLVVLPLLALDWRRHGAVLRVTAFDCALACAAFLVVALPWYVAMAAEHGLGYLERFFLAENLDRFTTDRYNAPRPAWYYLPIVAGGLLPWSPFMILWVRALRRARRDRTVDSRALRLAIWACAPLAFYTLSVGKQPRYILPLLAPLAILLARAMARGRRGFLPGCKEPCGGRSRSGSDGRIDRWAAPSRPALAARMERPGHAQPVRRHIARRHRHRRGIARRVASRSACPRHPGTGRRGGCGHGGRRARGRARDAGSGPGRACRRDALRDTGGGRALRSSPGVRSQPRLLHAHTARRVAGAPGGA